MRKNKTKKSITAKELGKTFVKLFKELAKLQKTIDGMKRKKETKNKTKKALKEVKK